MSNLIVKLSKFCRFSDTKIYVTKIVKLLRYVNLQVFYTIYQALQLMQNRRFLKIYIGR